MIFNMKATSNARGEDVKCNSIFSYLELSYSFHLYSAIRKFINKWKHFLHFLHLFTHQVTLSTSSFPPPKWALTDKLAGDSLHNSMLTYRFCLLLQFCFATRNAIHLTEYELNFKTSHIQGLRARSQSRSVSNVKIDKFMCSEMSPVIDITKHCMTSWQLRCHSVASMTHVDELLFCLVNLWSNMSIENRNNKNQQ